MEASLIKVNDNSDSVRENVQANIGDLSLLATTPHMNWSEMSESEHFVQFYETDDFLLDSLGGFISAGLSADEACIVVANKARRKALEKTLQAHGHDADRSPRARPIRLFGCRRDSVEIYGRWLALAAALY